MRIRGSSGPISTPNVAFGRVSRSLTILTLCRFRASATRAGFASTHLVTRRRLRAGPETPKRVAPDRKERSVCGDAAPRQDIVGDDLPERTVVPDRRGR